MGAGSDNDESHCFAAAERAFELDGHCVRRQHRRGEAPPNEARQGDFPVAAEGCVAGERRKGAKAKLRSRQTVTQRLHDHASNLGIHMTPGYIHTGHGTPPKIHPLGGRRR